MNKFESQWLATVALFPKDSYYADRVLRATEPCRRVYIGMVNRRHRLFLEDDLLLQESIVSLEKVCSNLIVQPKSVGKDSQIPVKILWRVVSSELPEIRRPILMKGNSGYVPPHDVFYVAGYYDPEFRPLSPWLDTQQECLGERGLKPICWIYLDELENHIRRLAGRLWHTSLRRE